MGKKVGEWYQYSGAIHIHTTESDGTKSFEEVTAIGRSVGLDFMLFSDHMTLVHREADREGYYGKTLVLVGYEHNDLDEKHHYLLFESPRVYPEDMTPKEYVAAGAADGAIGIMAHPDEIRDRMERFPPYPWEDWSVEGYTGIEIWNQMSEWMERLTPFNYPLMAFSPRKSMRGPTDRILCKWDELNMDRRVLGIASVDAHAFKIDVWPISNVEIFPYKVHFKCLRTHIILDEPLSPKFETAKAQLYGALRSCRCFSSNMRWGSADKFSFYAENDSARATCGDEIPIGDNCRLVVKLPARATLNLVHNGQTVVHTNTKELDFQATQPGIYRVEAWKGKRGWIFSNHIRVTP